MKRDLRDPEKVGRLLRHLTKPPYSLPVLGAADELECHHVPDYARNETCVEKYGRPDDVQPRFMEVQVR